MKMKDFTRDRNFPVIREFKARSNERELMQRHGAHSIGIGPKMENGKPTNKLAMQFFVTSKQESEELAERAIPPTITFMPRGSNQVRRITTDVIESPQASFEMFDPEARHRPVPGGVSGGISGSTGTIGGWVWDNTDDTIVMLSNEHVFESGIGSDILQQGTADGGSLPADKIGDVKRSIPRTTTGTNTVDAAIGDPDDSSIYSLEVVDIGPAVYAIEDATVGMSVEKYGQTTEHTFGTVLSVNYSTTLTSGHFFTDCIRVDAAAPSADWSAGGDSGSLVFSTTPTTEGGTIKPVVGLHFAGASTYGVECKIQNVFNALNLTTLCTGAFASFLDNLTLGESEDDESEDEMPAIDLRTTRELVPSGRPLLGAAGLTAVTPRSILQATSARLADRLVLTGKDRLSASALNPNRGLAVDVQLRLQASSSGRKVTGAVDEHRAELLTLLTRTGDVRRSSVRALRGVVRGATTTDDVLTRTLQARDVENFEKLADTISRNASEDLQAVVTDLRKVLRTAKGKSLAQIFKIG